MGRHSSALAADLPLPAPSSSTPQVTAWPSWYGQAHGSCLPGVTKNSVSFAVCTLHITWTNVIWKGGNNKYLEMSFLVPSRAGRASYNTANPCAEASPRTAMRGLSQGHALELLMRKAALGGQGNTPHLAGHRRAGIKEGHSQDVPKGHSHLLPQRSGDWDFDCLGSSATTCLVSKIPLCSFHPSPQAMALTAAPALVASPGSLQLQNPKLREDSSSSVPFHLPEAAGFFYNEPHNHVLAGEVIKMSKTRTCACQRCAVKWSSAVAELKLLIKKKKENLHQIPSTFKFCLNVTSASSEEMGPACTMNNPDSLLSSHQ